LHIQKTNTIEYTGEDEEEEDTDRDREDVDKGIAGGMSFLSAVLAQS